MSKVTRRRFLEDSMLAAAMAAAYPASRGFAAEEQSQARAKKKAGQRLRVAVVGVRSAATNTSRSSLATRIRKSFTSSTWMIRSPTAAPPRLASSRATSPRRCAICAWPWTTSRWT